MAVVEKPTTKSAMPANPAQRLAVASLLGGLYLFACLGLIFSGLPLVWDATVGNLLGNPYLSTSLLLIVTAVVAAGLVYLGRKLEGDHPLPGLRSGSVVAFVGLFLALLVAVGVANLLGYQDFGGASTVIVWGAAIIVALAIVAGMYFVLQQPGVSRGLVDLERQGWFHATSFKPTQGMKVRRGTLVALLFIVGCGIFAGSRSDLYRGVLGGGRWPDNQMEISVSLLGSFTLFNPQNHWAYFLPYTNDSYLFLLFNVQYTAPLILFAVLGWLSWRVTNWPAFADFLIATEAEMNKVSWTTRRRLIQDTIVVLVKVVLLTVFLFIVDILWIRILSVPGVLQFDPQEQRQRQREASEW